MKRGYKHLCDESCSVKDSLLVHWNRPLAGSAPVTPQHVTCQMIWTRNTVVPGCCGCLMSLNVFSSTVLHCLVYLDVSHGLGSLLACGFCPNRKVINCNKTQCEASVGWKFCFKTSLLHWGCILIMGLDMNIVLCWPNSEACVLKPVLISCSSLKDRVLPSIPNKANDGSFLCNETRQLLSYLKLE